MFQHKEVALGCKIHPLPPMKRKRAWRERLLSWPWRPWVAEAPTEYALLMAAREHIEREMRDIAAIDLYPQDVRDK